MPDCHNCPTGIEIAQGMHANTDWEDMPCAECQLSDTANNHGKSHVSMNAGKGTQTLGEVEAALQHRIDSMEPIRDDSPLEATRAALWDLIQMSSSHRDLSCWRIANPALPLRIFAKKNKITVQAVHARLYVIRKKYPEMKLFMNYKFRGRAPSGKFRKGHKHGFKAGWSGGPGRPGKK